VACDKCESSSKGEHMIFVLLISKGSSEISLS
jgi:hypothetical protein